MTEVDDLRREIAALRHQVLEARQAAAAVAQGEVDAVTSNGLGHPLPLKSAQDELRRSQALLRAVFDASLDAKLLTNDDGVYVDANLAASAMWGLPREKLVGSSAADLATQDPGAPARFRTLLDEKRVQGRFALERGARVIDFYGLANVAPGLHLWTLRDVTDRVAAGEALRRSEARFRAMIEKSHDGITLLGPDIRAIYQTPSVHSLLGYTFEESRSMDWRQFVDERDVPTLASALAALLSEPSVPVHLEYRSRRPDGSTRWIELAATNLLADPDVGALVTNFRDVTARKVAELEAARARSLLEQAEEIANLGSWAAGETPDSPISWSVECARIFGRAPSPAPSALELLSMVHPEDRGRVIDAARRAAADGVPTETEHRIVLPSGNVRWVRAKAVISNSLRWDGDSAVVVGDADRYRVIGVVQDITEQKSLLRSRDRFFELSLDLFCVGTIDGRLEEVSPSWTTLLGWSREEIVGRPWLDFVHPDDRQATRDVGSSLAVGKPVQDFENRYLCKDGSVRWLSWCTQTAVETGQVFGVARDATHRRRSEERLRLLETCVSRLNDAVMITSGGAIDEPGPEILYVNEAFTRITGYAAEEAMGRSPRFLQGKETERQVLGDIRAALERREAVRAELVNYRKDGTTYRVELQVTPVFGARGDVTHFVGVQRDVTDQHHAREALRRSDEQLRQAQKMEAVGSLAGGIAHDFNNLLTVILSYTELLVDELPVADPTRKDLQEIHGAGMRARELTSQLLAFSRKQILTPSVVDIRDILNGVAPMLRRLLGEDVELTLLFSTNTGRIFADPGQIEQVVMNLVVNARDALPDGGNITIETSCVVLEDAYASQHLGVPPGAYVLLAVSDTGVGIDRATQERVFEPFFTTKEKGRGTGLGLSTVYGIVQQSGGHIWLYSEPGHGTTFKIYLPRTDRVPEESEPPPARGTALRGTETILLVEDETPVRTIVATILRRSGYHVLEASNGGEALLLCEQFGGAIHLLLTDVVMPLMSGRQLVERLSPLRPTMKVLFVSGYTENTIVHHGVLDAGVEFLAKPVLPEALLRKVRHILDARPRLSIAPT